MDKHLDMETLTKEILAKREKNIIRKAICEGNINAMQELKEKGGKSWGWVSEDYRDIPGQRQVQSLLRFVADKTTERSIEDAEADNIVYDQLGEHRILGAKKSNKKRKRKMSTY